MRAQEAAPRARTRTRGGAARAHTRTRGGAARMLTRGGAARAHPRTRGARVTVVGPAGRDQQRHAHRPPHRLQAPRHHRQGGRPAAAAARAASVPAASGRSRPLGLWLLPRARGAVSDSGTGRSGQAWGLSRTQAPMGSCARSRRRGGVAATGSRRRGRGGGLGAWGGGQAQPTADFNGADSVLEAKGRSDTPSSPPAPPLLPTPPPLPSPARHDLPGMCLGHWESAIGNPHTRHPRRRQRLSGRRPPVARLQPL